MDAMNIGLRSVAVDDIATYHLYATDAPMTAQTFGPHTFDAAVDAKPLHRDMPVVVVSHGMQGTPWGYRGLSMHLARAGFLVVLVEHPGDSRRDGRLAGTAEILALRPRHIRAVLDSLGVESAAIIGHSMGGYTALAAVGGKPMALPNQTPDGIAKPVDVQADPRVKCAVVLGPAIPWFMAPGALASVDVPVMVRVGEHDTDAPPFFVEPIVRGVKQLDYAVVPGAGHFAFFYPIPPALQRLPPGQDPPGFDRAAYQPQLYAEVEAFVRAGVCRR
jgi:pimeloyl-ACP methyl ester carboxylesterase